MHLPGQAGSALHSQTRKQQRRCEPHSPGSRRVSHQGIAWKSRPVYKLQKHHNLGPDKQLGGESSWPSD